MGHLSKVDAAEAPLFDAKFCARDPSRGCMPTLPVDVVQHTAGGTYTVLSQVLTPAGASLLTTIDESGNVKGATRYVAVQELRAAQFVPNAGGDSYLVVGSCIDPKGNRAENDSALGVSSVLRATPTVTTSNALFKQVAQAP
jgi:hypothetical protein